MEEIIKKEWFWIGIFSMLSAITGSGLTIIANYWKEKSRRITQIKVEKIKMYDEKKFNAYLEVYEFISTAYSFYAPEDDPKDGFILLMKKYFFKHVKQNYPYMNSEIREKIKILESQYICHDNSFFNPQISSEQFFRTEYLKILKELNDILEKIFDKWENK
jgi:hypothetical protein